MEEQQVGDEIAFDQHIEQQLNDSEVGCDGVQRSGLRLGGFFPMDGARKEIPGNLVDLQRCEKPPS
jgi:hypothetical protein